MTFWEKVDYATAHVVVGALVFIALAILYLAGAGSLDWPMP